MLAQFSVSGNQNVRGTFGLTYRGAGAPADTFVQNVTFTTAVPAPGALALLGLAGLVGSRRRRA
jgi:MYXO-CTERM domain-containing protein